MRPYNLRPPLLLLALFVLIPAVFPLEVSGYEANKSAIVLLTAKNQEGKVLGTGTGFIVKPEGILITNYHVLVDAAEVEAVFSDGRLLPVERVLKVDRIKDFAILKLKDGFYSTLEMGNSDLVREFDYNSALGYLAQSAARNGGTRNGKILQTYGFTLGYLPQADPGFSFIYTTAPFGPGFSGGPLVDKDNKVVGIATVEGRSINLALPVNYVKPFLSGTKSTSLKQLLEQDKESKEARYYRGNYALYVLGEPERAVRDFQEALEMDPDFVLARYDLAAAYASMRMTRKSIEEYSKVVQLNPAFPEALSNLGGYYFREGKIEEAVALFEKAIEVHPNFIQALSNLGAVLNKLNRPRKALVYLKRALALDPDFGISYFNLGNAHSQLNHWEDALGAYDNAVKLGVDFLSLHWNRYEIYQKQGKIREAAKELNLILQIDPNNEDARQKLDELTPKTFR
ncbi:MAG: tetratricopeptide repeat protein [Nitrospinaceae bacterium]